MKGWIYTLPKAQLAVILRSYDLDDSGLLDELRRRKSNFVDTNPDEFDPPGGETSAGAAPCITVTTPNQHEHAVEAPATDAKVINQIRKWGCHFDGRDPAAFLERLRELRDGYGISGPQMLKGLPEMLKGDTLLWYRNHREDWRTWHDFERAFHLQFFPRRYAATLRREIMGRHQTSGEEFTRYSTVMMTLMRRAGGFSREEQLDLIYENMHPEYKAYVRVDDVRSIAELQSRAKEFEDIEREKRELKKRERPTPAVAATYNKRECCWRCKQRGHTRGQCRRPALKFCSQCGKDGVLTSECHPRPGNASGVGDLAVAAPAQDSA